MRLIWAGVPHACVSVPGLDAVLGLLGRMARGAGLLCFRACSPVATRSSLTPGAGFLLISKGAVTLIAPWGLQCPTGCLTGCGALLDTMPSWFGCTMVVNYWALGNVVTLVNCLGT